VSTWSAVLGLSCLLFVGHLPSRRRIQTFSVRRITRKGWRGIQAPDGHPYVRVGVIWSRKTRLASVQRVTHTHALTSIQPRPILCLHDIKTTDGPCVATLWSQTAECIQGAASSVQAISGLCPGSECKGSLSKTPLNFVFGLAGWFLG